MMTRTFFFTFALFFSSSILIGRRNAENSKAVVAELGNAKSVTDRPENFNPPPKLEKDYEDSHAVKIGDSLLISGAVRMTDSGVVIDPGNMEILLKHCYNGLGKILQHDDYRFDDIYAENTYTTDMKDFERVSGFRNTICKEQFPTGTGLEVKAWTLVDRAIGIDLDGIKQNE